MDEIVFSLWNSTYSYWAVSDFKQNTFVLIVALVLMMSVSVAGIRGYYVPLNWT